MEKRILHMSLMWMVRPFTSKLQPVIMITDSELNVKKQYYRIPNETMLEFRMRIMKDVYFNDFKGEDVFDHNVLPGFDLDDLR